MRIWILLIFFCVHFQAKAQYQLHISCDACTTQGIKSFKTDFSDSISILQYLQLQRLILIGQGFAEASIDTISFRQKKAFANIHIAEKYHLYLINLQEIPAVLRPKRKLTKNNMVFAPFELQEYLTEILAKATQNGYPVADVFLDSISISQNQLTAKLVLKKGIYVQYEKVIKHGKIDLQASFLQNYLNLKPGMPFNLAEVKKIKKKIDELDFVQMTAPPNIQLKGDKAIIKLPLKEKKANQFNFLIGVLPNNDETKKILLVGNALIDFKNMLGFGERFYLKFDQSRPQTQQLALKTTWPYPFDIPVGFDASFQLYKRDTAYLDVHSQLAARYYLQGHKYLKFFWQITKSNLLNINTTQLIVSQKLPQNLDFSSSLFGLEYGVEKLDFRLNPRKGWAFRTKVGGGILKHPSNPKITEIIIPNKPDFSFQELYDSLDQKSWEVRSEIQLNTYLPIFKNSVIAFFNQAAWSYTPTTLSRNQLFRLGGNQLLRGFDEESIFASFYNVSSLEYRLLIGRTSYLYVFSDYGFTQHPFQTMNVNSKYLGFGAGMSFQTKSGLFRISYALGKNDVNPLDTKSAKIHLGYQSVF